MRKYFIYSVIILILILAILIWWKPYHWWLVFFLIPIAGWGFVDTFQKDDSIGRIYPLSGSINKFIESQRHDLEGNCIAIRINEKEVISYVELFPKNKVN